jgi:hypothetical protein
MSRLGFDEIEFIFSSIAGIEASKFFRVWRRNAGCEKGPSIGCSQR